MIEFVIIPLPPSLNKMLLMNHHARTRLKANIRKQIWAQVAGQKVSTTYYKDFPLQKVIIHAHRYAVRRLDGFDNYRASLKWVVDALTTRHNGLGIIQDDDDNVLKVGNITQVKVAHINQERLEFFIEPQSQDGTRQ